MGTAPYKIFLQELRGALTAESTVKTEPLLNGQAGARCQQLVSEATRQRLGAFFTPSETALLLNQMLSVRKWADTVVLDPACGAGDLLLPIARRLPKRKTVSQTLRLWNQHLIGCDLSKEFVHAARLRMVLLAVDRGATLDARPDALAKILSNLRVADGLRVQKVYKQCTHIVMNPPYARVKPAVGTPWREGSVTSAALFVERAVHLSRAGTQVLALLPEVLRTGTSYSAWRSHIATLATTDRMRSLGLFSAQADIDVFLQRLTRRDKVVRKRTSRQVAGRDCIGDHFLVRVGPVVPHRHSNLGPSKAFLHASNSKPWTTIRRINESRQFVGTVFKPPFVVIRRTSRPGDGNRATASLVLGRREVAVENHLIVALPLRGGEPICRKLLQLLASRQIDARLDRTMRCRHLTTSSVSSLPWA